MDKTYVREVKTTDHIGLRVHAEDAPGAGGAQHAYRITGYDTSENKSRHQMHSLHSCALTLFFQNGPITTTDGPNGITQEVLLAIVRDRLEAFQRGPFPCVENECALEHIRAAEVWLKQRTESREKRGVEGKNAQ